jgi:hypothetical protein
MKFWKIERFFNDVVYDLRERGLLPVAIGLVVAMVAVPLIISRGGGSDAPAPSPSTNVEQASELAPETQSAVLTHNPGIRNYKDRLADLPAKDPFTQQFQQSAQTASEVTESPTGTTGGSADAGGGAAPVEVPDSGGSTTTTGTRTIRYFYSEADVLIGDAAAPLQRRNKLAGFTPLPSEQTPVAIFIGASLDAKVAYFILSSEVSQVTGDGTCAPSPTDCSLLALQRGQAENMLYDIDGKTYRLKVLKIKRVVTRKPPRG